ncbi:MAG: hypothetical protein ACTSQJ_17825, partial [Promethearchaeota archaeon]
MGIFYLSGVGLSPGSATIPLQYLYLMQKMARNGNNQAQDFFKESGEKREKDKGIPECLIFFTSKEVIEGEKPPLRNLEDYWYKIRINEQKNIPRLMLKTLRTLTEECGLEDIFNK